MVVMSDRVNNSVEDPADVVAILDQVGEGNEQAADESSVSASSSTSESELESIDEDDGLFLNPSEEWMVEFYEMNERCIAQFQDRRSLQQASELLRQRERYCRTQMRLRLDAWHFLRNPTPEEVEEARQNIWGAEIDFAAVEDALGKVRRLLNIIADNDSDASSGNGSNDDP